MATNDHRMAALFRARRCACRTRPTPTSRRTCSRAASPTKCSRSCAPTRSCRRGNPQKVTQLVEAKVLPHFNFARMTQLAVGPQLAPGDARAAEGADRGVPTLLVRTYTTAFTQYRNQTIDYRPLRMRAERHRRRREVAHQAARRASRSRSTTAWRSSASAWKVYDVKIEGISLVENYRNTFNTEIQRSGIDGSSRRSPTRTRRSRRRRAALADDLVRRRALQRSRARSRWTTSRGARRERARFSASPRVVVDLGGVTEVDSAAVSLLLEWRRAARQREPPHRVREPARQPEEPRRALRRVAISSARA